MALPFDQRKVH